MAYHPKVPMSDENETFQDHRIDDSDTPVSDLPDLREKIDELDRKLVQLLNERARLVVEVGRSKRDTGAPIYAPHRESAVLSRVLELSQGPLPQRSVEAIYREIMSGSFALERPLRIGFLGPPGSFSHQAAVRHFGSSVSFEDLHEIAGVFTEVRRGHVDYGLAPIENSQGGGIVETYDAFRECAGDVNVYAEAQLAVHHALLANGEPSQIKTIYSKPEVFSQCRKWLATQFPRAELIPAASTAQAVNHVHTLHEDNPESGAAAIGSDLAGQLYGVEVLFERIEDNPNNVTRFAIISRQKAKPSGQDKTSIMFNTTDQPGALVRVLQVFEDAGINLTHIDKRPSGRSNWQYTFFIDAEGHRDDTIMARAVLDAEAHCADLIVLGSYPKSKRIL